MSNDRSYYRFTRSEVLPYLPNTYRRVLEIGCGEGHFSKQLETGAETWGIEFNEEAARAARGHMRTVLTGTYEAVRSQLPDKYFDLVICNDVIEHMADHDAFLESIRGKIAIGGCLVASIPNVRHFRNLYELLFQKDWRYRDAGILDRTHLRFFTEKSIRRAFLQHGFQMDAIGGINRPSRWKKRIAPIFFGLVTFGYFWDIQFQQFVVRARIPDRQSPRPPGPP